MVFIQAGLGQCFIQLFQFRRHHALAQVHGGLGVLHGAVVDDDQLLHLARNCAAGVGGQLRRVRQGGSHQKGRCNGKLNKSLEQFLPPNTFETASTYWTALRGSLDLKRKTPIIVAARYFTFLLYSRV